MGIAAGLVAVLLFVIGVLVSFGPGAHRSGSLPEKVLAVVIKQHEPEPVAGAQAIEPAEAEAAPDYTAPPKAAYVPEEAPTPAQTVTPSVQRSRIDWAAAMAETAAALEREKRDSANLRKSMWRQTGSVMFRAEDEFVPAEQQPVLAGLRFRPELHVVGLGVKIGSCFVGLPLVGVPVEKRTAGVRLFVCAGDSG